LIPLRHDDSGELHQVYLTTTTGITVIMRIT